jgi:hypothetical protein
MKKSALIAILGLGTAIASNGQGLINFSNYYSTTSTTGVTYGSGPAVGLAAGPEISAILLWGASTSTAISQLTAIGGSTTPFGMGAAAGPDAFGTGAGWFSGGTISINGGTAGTYAFAIEATGTYLGVPYIGFSPVVNGPTSADALSAAPDLPIALMHGSFTVNPVPEPSTIALGVLGGLGLLMFRRKQS